MNNHIIQGLIDIGASMLIITINVVRELGIMHLVVSLKSYKIAFRVVI
jgi:predicted aspartyl protease